MRTPKKGFSNERSAFCAGKAYGGSALGSLGKEGEFMAVNVAANGYGNIGKRVADAEAKQDDMKLVGVPKTSPNFEAFVAAQKGHQLYVAERYPAWN
jgi:hypothetical protein